MFNPKEIPTYLKLLQQYAHAVRYHRKSLKDLFAFYLNSKNPDVLRGAHLQLLAHQAEQELLEAIASLSKDSWSLVPFNNSEEHKNDLQEIKNSIISKIIQSDEPEIVDSYVVVTLSENFIQESSNVKNS